MALDINQELTRPNITIYFTGPISVELVDAILGTLDRKLDKKEGLVPLRRKVYGVANEALQNLVKHIESFSSSEDNVEYDLQECSFSVQKIDEQYNIQTGNFITNKKVQLLKMWLTEINKVGKDGLDNLYNQILKNKQFSHKGGAGLGMVDIAKKADDKLEFSFEQVDDKYSIFKLRIKISSN